MQEEDLTEKTAKQLNSVFLSTDIDSAKAFSEIAQGYDALLTKDFYLSPQKCLELLLTVCSLDPKLAPVLDLGCGTGLVGELLRAKGFQRVVGLDASEEMLKIAQDKALYEQLHLCYLGTGTLPQSLKCQFDVVVMAGVLNQNHAPPEALDDAVSCLREKGVMVFSLPDIVGEEKGYLGKVKEKEIEKQIKMIGSLKFENFKAEAATKQSSHLLKPVGMTAYVYQRI